jgi:hypothetical protein
MAGCTRLREAGRVLNQDQAAGAVSLTRPTKQPPDAQARVIDAVVGMETVEQAVTML